MIHSNTVTVMIVFQLAPNVCDFSSKTTSYCSGYHIPAHHVVLHGVALNTLLTRMGYSAGCVSATIWSVLRTWVELNETLGAHLASSSDPDALTSMAMAEMACARKSATRRSISEFEKYAFGASAGGRVFSSICAHSKMFYIVAT